MLYPNPAREMLSIEAKSIRQVRIYDLFGQTCIAHSNLLTDKLIVNITSLNPALYFVEICTDYGKCVRKVEVVR